MSVAERLPKDYSWRPTTASGRVLGWLLVTFGVLSLLEAAFQLDRAISATALTGTSDDVWFRLVQEAQSFRSRSRPGLSSSLARRCG